MVAIGTWLAALMLALEYLWAWGMPPGAFFREATYPTGRVGDLVTGTHVSATFGIWLTLAGIGGLFVAPLLTAGVATLDARAARALLGPSRAEELEHRVERLTQTRAGVVDAADAERRRLERDLHDGTQQRLVSLAINLGMARVNSHDRRGSAAGTRAGPRGGQGRAVGAAGPDPGTAPGRARGPGPGRRAVRRRGPHADPRPAERGPAAPPGTR